MTEKLPFPMTEEEFEAFQRNLQELFKSYQRGLIAFQNSLIELVETYNELLKGYDKND